MELLLNLSKFTYNTTKLTFHNCLNNHVNVVDTQMFVPVQGSRQGLGQFKNIRKPFKNISNALAKPCVFL